MHIDSLDPRVNRLKLPLEPNDTFLPAEEMDQWQTYEVFHQEARGNQHIHVGSVHAPNAEMALLYAKEQYARRFKCVNLWVVKTADVVKTEYDDSDMFEPATDKTYRESSGYKNTRKLIDKFKLVNQINTPNTSDDDLLDSPKSQISNPQIVTTNTGGETKKTGIVIGKKK